MLQQELCSNHSPRLPSQGASGGASAEGRLPGRVTHGYLDTSRILESWCLRILDTLISMYPRVSALNSKVSAKYPCLPYGYFASSADFSKNTSRRHPTGDGIYTCCLRQARLPPAAACDQHHKPSASPNHPPGCQGTDSPARRLATTAGTGSVWFFLALPKDPP